MNALSLKILRAGGVLLLLVGLQAWAFQLVVMPRSETSYKNLSALIEESSSHAQLDSIMKLLRELNRATQDSNQRQEILALRDTLMREFQASPKKSLDAAVRAAAALSGNSEREIELRTSLNEKLTGLRNIYFDSEAGALSSYLGAPFYLQPTAAILAMRGTTRDRLEINQSMYLMLSGDRNAANLLLDELRRDTHPDEIRSHALFILARLKFNEFLDSGADEHFRYARQYTRQSLTIDSQQEQPKLFLEYLLAMDAQAVEVDSAPEEGEGSGESKGERGSISNESPEH